MGEEGAVSQGSVLKYFELKYLNIIPSGKDLEEWDLEIKLRGSADTAWNYKVNHSAVLRQGLHLKTVHLIDQSLSRKDEKQKSWKKNLFSCYLV